jgi:hypothetical protein
MTGSGALLMVAKCNGSDPSSLAAAFPSFEGSASHPFTKKLEQLRSGVRSHGARGSHPWQSLTRNGI